MNKIIPHLRGAIKSWTIRFNAISAAVLGAIPILQNQLPQFQEYINDADYKKIAFWLIIGNTILRVKTNKSLADK